MSGCAGSDTSSSSRSHDLAQSQIGSAIDERLGFLRVGRRKFRHGTALGPRFSSAPTLDRAAQGVVAQ
jgi:hypothetical protein